jgi:hypothetical protein
VDGERGHVDLIAVLVFALFILMFLVVFAPTYRWR